MSVRYVRFVLAASAAAGGLSAAAWAGPVTPQRALGEPLHELTPDQLVRWQIGRIDYNTPLQPSEGLGPVFNKESCGNCHANPLGGPGSQTVTRFGVDDKKGGGFNPLEEFGGSLLQAQAIDPACQETLPDVPGLITSARLTIGSLGYGLIESIPDADILALEQDPPGVSGRARWVEPLEAPGTMTVGKFGWKSGVGTVLSFSGDAAQNEMGLSNRLLPFDNDPNGILDPLLADCDTVPDPEDGPDETGAHFIDRITDFQRFIAQPPQTPKSGMTGETIFMNVGCGQCHTPQFTTSNDPALEDALRNKVIRPYSDFLLHDMGLSADFIPDGFATGQEIKTTPLWGLRNRDPLWHNGEIGGGTFAERVTEAIEAHGVFGNETLDSGIFGNWQALSGADKDLLVQFLDSLGRREFDINGDDAIDLDDFNDFKACFGGGPYSPDDPCAISDIDQDGDVDLDDFESFLLVFDGSTRDCNGNGTLDLIDILVGDAIDANGDGLPDVCEACPADFDGSGDVGFLDILRILSAWGQCAACIEDLDHNGEVGFSDLVLALGAWGSCTP